MIRRFYADNFRCLVNFELELDELNVFLGANGTGKSSVFDVLWKIQRLVCRGRKVDEVFPQRDLSKLYADDEDGTVRQTFETDVGIEGCFYRYRLVIGHDVQRRRMRIEEEVLTCDGEQASYLVQLRSALGRPAGPDRAVQPSVFLAP